MQCFCSRTSYTIKITPGCRYDNMSTDAELKRCALVMGKDKNWHLFTTL